MSRYLRGAFGTADSRGDLQSFVSDLKYANSIAGTDAADADAEAAKLKAGVESAMTAARGSLPRNKYFAAGRGPNLADLKKVSARKTETLLPERLKLQRLLGEWTATPFDARKYAALAEHVPKSGTSEFAGVIKEIVILGDGDLTLHHSARTGCWTMNFGPDQRLLIDSALEYARLILGFLAGHNLSKEPVGDIFDEYFGVFEQFDDDMVKQVKEVFSSVSEEMLGSNRCRLVMAPPCPKAGPRGSGRDTLAYVRADAFPRDKGAMIFLGKQFFSGKKTVADRAATLIHEATHYFADTVDEDENGSEAGCYGRKDCKRMAKIADNDKRRKTVLRNAETYCLFAQDAYAASLQTG